jgi:hypothetical protein
MGKFCYDDRFEIELEDRPLYHLQIVIVDKLRRQETFAFTLANGGTRMVTMWMTPCSPLEFVYGGNRIPWVNHTWLELLASAASSARGLVLVPEPQEPIDRFTTVAPPMLRERPIRR